MFVPPTFLPPGGVDSGESTNGSGDASTSAQQFQFVQNQANSRVPHSSVSFQPTSAQGYSFEPRERLLQRQIEVTLLLVWALALIITNCNISVVFKIYYF